jgi:hypothetical protein
MIISFRNVTTKYAIARAWYITRMFIVKDSEFTKSKFCTEKCVYENVYAGDEQSMKTPVQLVIQYFLTLAFGIIGVMVVRNNGGKDHIDKCKNYIFSAEVKGRPYKGKLNEIIKKIMQEEYKQEWDVLLEDQRNMFNINIYDNYSETNFSKIKPKYGHLNNAFMLFGLYNKSFLNKIENVLIPNENTDSFKRSSESKYLFRYKNFVENLLEYFKENTADEYIMKISKDCSTSSVHCLESVRIQTFSDRFKRF